MNLPDGPITGEYVHQWVKPLFSEVLYREEVYLANHSLGRPLDQTRMDVAEGMSHWYADMDTAWDAWVVEMDVWRSATAALLGLDRRDCVVPRTSCGQALRAVLNSFSSKKLIRVVTSDQEFDSIDFVLRAYHEAQRADVTFVPSGRRCGAPWVDAGKVAEQVLPGTDLLVISAVTFSTGQIVKGLNELVSRAHSVGAMVLVDAYHAVGVVPFGLGEADYAMGGSYKYLRGGPGACWLAVHPRHLGVDGPKTLDTGWFAKEDTFGYGRGDEARRKRGGDGWLESTPAVLPFYQARAGLRFMREVGVDRMREYCLGRTSGLRAGLREAGLPVLDTGDDQDFGGFVCVAHPRAVEAADRLRARMVNTDARGGYVRFGPDILTTDEETAAAVLAATAVWDS